VLEIGAGAGASAVAAVLLGAAHVTATDGDEPVVALCAENCAAALDGREGLGSCESKLLRWGNDEVRHTPPNAARRRHHSAHPSKEVLEQPAASSSFVTPTLHPKPYTLHPTPYTLHPLPKPYTLSRSSLTLQPWIISPLHRILLTPVPSSPPLHRTLRRWTRPTI